MTAGTVGRMRHMAQADDRVTGVLFRMSHDEKAQLKTEAKALGITVQALLERRVLGKADAQPRQPGRVPAAQKEALFSMTG
jgi:hypothetical protein